MLSVAPGTDDTLREKQKENPGVKEARTKGRKKTEKKPTVHTDSTHIVPTQAPLFISEVHCCVILRMISHFALSD